MENFYVLLNRMKVIERWSLMRRTSQENVMEHAAQVAILGQALALIKNKKFGGNVNVDKVAALALYHDAPEVVSGDLPTPIKYFNTDMVDAYAEIEKSILTQFNDLAPAFAKDEYKEYLMPDTNSEEYILMKLADKLSAMIKCIEERVLGNHEFVVSYQRLTNSLHELKPKHPELEYFMDNYLAGFGEPSDMI